MSPVSRAVLAGATLVPLAILPLQASRPSVEGNTLQFRLADLDGQFVSSSDARFADRVMLVVLWGTWCPPCLSEIPTLIELQDELGDRGLLVVAIAFEAEEEPEARRERLREFSRQREINYLVLDGGLPEEFESTLPGVRNVKGLPVEILVDRGGRVVSARNSFGYKKGWVKKLRRELEALLEVER